MLLLLLMGAGGELLAPGPRELAAHLTGTRERLEESRAIGGTVARLQNAIAGKLAAKVKPCEDPELGAWRARLQAFGPAWRDAAQSARAEADRLEVVIGSPTAAPLLDARTRAEAEALIAGVDEQAHAYLEAGAWQLAVLGPAVKACPAPALAVGPGLGAAQGPYAVIAYGDYLCPGMAPALGVSVVEGPVCLAAQSCDCTPSEVGPGAVLGL